MIMRYDIVIIGGGFVGYIVVERVGVNGLCVVLFEKKVMGGVCFNEGCIFIKVLFYFVKVLDGIKSVLKYGVLVEGVFVFDMEKIIGWKNKMVQKLMGGVRMMVNFYGVIIVDKEVVIEGEGEEGFYICCDGEVYEVIYLLVCIGLDIVIFLIKGFLDVDYWIL